jgi:hypothetical protein
MHHSDQPMRSSRLRRTIVIVPCWMIALRWLRVTMPMWKKPRYSAWHIALNALSAASR